MTDFLCSRRLSPSCVSSTKFKLSLFGSTLKGTARPDSDVDLPVEFEQGARPTLLDIAQIEIELPQLLGGRKVDLRTPEDLSRHFREEVLRTAEPQYVAGCSLANPSTRPSFIAIGWSSWRQMIHAARYISKSFAVCSNDPRDFRVQ